MNQAKINKNFWFDHLQVNAKQAIFHQWDQLVASGCIENFRIAAGEAEGFREGWFFADSDAYKWLDAAARIWRDGPDERLAVLMDDLIALIGRAQMPDGYIFTYNQIHFPGARWQNLQIEHELYCHGHLIEAGVSHFQATGRKDLLDMARKAADRIVSEFHGKGPAYTPGHEEIELALLRLHQVVPGDSSYLAMARQFIERRGLEHGFAMSILRQNSQAAKKKAEIQRQRQEYITAHPDFKPFVLPADNFSKRPANTRLRWYISALTGKYFQQHEPIRLQTVPVGHSVRFGYLETAAAMLARETSDRSLTTAIEQAWERMVTRRMYVTGGLGAVPGLEGFGNDYELDPEYAYTETCAALASLFWNWEMALLTGEAKYSDLFEWQLYNAAAVGMGLDGKTYLYNNPLECHGGVERKPWYSVPCCPSNLSRTWADMGRYIYSTQSGKLYIHQYISSEWMGEAPSMDSFSIEMESGLPWAAHVRLVIKQVPPGFKNLEILARWPSWAESVSMSINGEQAIIVTRDENQGLEPTASGFDPRPASFIPLKRAWTVGDVIELTFPMPVMSRKSHPKVKGHRGKIAITRGPLVYCLESTDNLDVDIFTARVDPSTLTPIQEDGLLGGIAKLVGKTVDGQPLTFIPYFLWGNRGPSQMTVWVNAA